MKPLSTQWTILIVLFMALGILWMLFAILQYDTKTDIESVQTVPAEQEHLPANENEHVDAASTEKEDRVEHTEETPEEIVHDLGCETVGERWQFCSTIEYHDPYGRATTTHVYLVEDDPAETEPLQILNTHLCNNFTWELLDSGQLKTIQESSPCEAFVNIRTTIYSVAGNKAVWTSAASSNGSFSGQFETSEPFVIALETSGECTSPPFTNTDPSSEILGLRMHSNLSTAEREEYYRRVIDLGNQDPDSTLYPIESTFREYCEYFYGGTIIEPSLGMPSIRNENTISIYISEDLTALISANERGDITIQYE